MKLPRMPEAQPLYLALPAGTVPTPALSMFPTMLELVQVSPMPRLVSEGGGSGGRGDRAPGDTSALEQSSLGPHPSRSRYSSAGFGRGDGVGHAAPRWQEVAGSRARPATRLVPTARACGVADASWSGLALSHEREVQSGR